MLQLSERGAISTSHLTNSFGWTSADSFAQQDVQECMAVIFDFIVTQCHGSPLGTFFASSWEGTYFDSLTCAECSRSRGQQLNFRDLQIQVRGMHNVESSLHSFFQQEAMEGVECGHCDKRTTHLKGFKLQRLPYILSLQLKRFDLDWNTFQRVKLGDKLDFPPHLDMAPFMPQPPFTESERSPGPNGGPDGGDISPPQVYDLLAVLVHTGSAMAGHYFCYVKDHCSANAEEEGEERWLCFNDSSVTALSPIEVESVLGFAPRAASSAGYVAGGGETTARISPSAKGEGMGHATAGTSAATTGGKQHRRHPITISITISIVNSNVCQFLMPSQALGVPLLVSCLSAPKHASCASSAYMLLYRRAGPENVNVVPAAAVPRPLRDWVEEDNVKYQALKAEWEYVPLASPRLHFPRGENACDAPCLIPRSMCVCG